MLKSSIIWIYMLKKYNYKVFGIKGNYFRDRKKYLGDSTTKEVTFNSYFLLFS